MKRREALELLAVASLAGAFDWAPVQVGRAAERLRAAQAAGQAFTPRFFTAHEYDTVRVLVDLIIPRDERSGSATDAGVPEVMDFLMTDGSDAQRTAMRGGLAWLDIQCRKRYGKSFVECADAERTAVLDEVAWPARARPDMNQGVAFFNSFRDLTASGFFSSRIGVADLRYLGNTFVPE